MDMGFAPTTLGSRYTELDRPVLLSGIQAIVRVLLEQSRLDRLAGLHTGGLASGYRGSPLGGLDQELWRQEALLTGAGVRFQPGLNEDLAATMLWGAQQVETFPGKRVDGVAQVPQQVPAVHHLDSIRRALAGTVGIGAGPVACDHLHAGVLAQPGGQDCSLPVRQEVHDGVALQVHQRRAVAVAPAPRPIIDAQHARGRGRLDAAAA